MQSSLYWSATTDTSVTSNGWFADFNSGNVSSADKDHIALVWCVRGGQGVDALRFGHLGYLMMSGSGDGGAGLKPAPTRQASVPALKRGNPGGYPYDVVAGGKKMFLAPFWPR